MLYMPSDFENILRLMAIVTMNYVTGDVTFNIASFLNFPHATVLEVTTKNKELWIDVQSHNALK